LELAELNLDLDVFEDFSITKFIDRGVADIVVV
jgi:hypothetical protein